MPRKRKNMKNGVAKEPEDPINHVESVDDLISLLPIPPAESFRTNDNKENSETYEFKYYKSSECWSNDKEVLDQKMEKMECEIEELKLERKELMEKIDILESKVKISDQEKAEAVRKLKQMEEENEELKSKENISDQKIEEAVQTLKIMECENEKLKVERKELVEKIDNLKAEVKISDQKIAETVRKLKYMEEEKKDLESEIELSDRKRMRYVNENELRGEITEFSIKNDDLMNKYNLSKSIQETLEKRILNHEYTIAELNSKNLKKDILIKNQKDELDNSKKILLNKKRECENLMINHFQQMSSLQAQVADLQKKRKPFFRWLLTGIWNGFSNLCGRFRDHFIRQNIYWKLCHIVIILSSLKFLMKPRIITCTFCEEDLEI